MRAAVEKLNSMGIETLGSCCGHGKYKKTIVVKLETGIFEWFSMKPIPRIRRFYRRDKQGRLGHYYIPEVEGK